MAEHVPTRRPRRQSLGQHFLESEPLVTRLVADACIGPGDTVVDLGAGHGALTDALARRARHVIAVELDAALAAALTRRFTDTANVAVLHADICGIALPRTHYRVVANPPWSCTAEVVHHLLDDVTGGLVRADLVLQWQVTRARVSGHDLLGAIWWPWWHFARGRRIPASLFRPAPSVDAAVLTITRREPPLLPADHCGRYSTFVRDAWSARREHLAADAWLERYRRAI